jgi:hypothetical protein
MASIALLILSCSFFSTPPRIFATPTPQPTATPSREKLPDIGNTWKIKMTQSGGIMGLLRTIEISSDGNFTVLDERTKKNVSGTLSPKDITNLKEQISTSGFISDNNPKNAACADCFVYDLEIQGDKGKFSTQLNDISLPNSGLESLVTFLRDSIDAALK